MLLRISKLKRVMFLLALLGSCLVWVGCRSPLNGGAYAADSQSYYLVPAKQEDRGFFGNIIHSMTHGSDDEWEVRYRDAEDYSGRKWRASEEDSILK